MPKGFTEQEKALLQQRLLEQGYKQFSAYGLKKTTVEELAAAVGISKGAFYLFYESKEALFMDVIEEAEKRLRQEVLAVIDLPGPSPRARLFAVLKKAFDIFESMPILQFLTGNDYDLLFHRISAGKLQEHVDSDRVFIAELMARCQKAGIPIRAPAGQVVSLLYPLVLTILNEGNWGRDLFGNNTDLYLELVAAFCLGEVEIQFAERAVDSGQ